MPSKLPESRLSPNAHSELINSWAVLGRSYAPQTPNAVICEYALAVKVNAALRTGFSETLHAFQIDLAYLPRFWINGMWDRAQSARKIGKEDAQSQSTGSSRFKVKQK